MDRKGRLFLLEPDPDDTHLEEVKRRLLAAYSVGDAAPAPRPLILERLE